MMPSPAGTLLTPRRLLCLFCVMNLLVYCDRGVVSSNGVNGAPATAENPGYGIQGEFGLSLFEDGVLPAAFMVGLLVSSPLFAEASKYCNALRLIGVGLGVWTAAAAGCGLAWDFWSLVIFRMAVGVGEASFVSLAAPFIDDNAPKERKAAWLAYFYLCIPVGYALGYIFGGLVSIPLGWRAAFLLEAAAMLPFVVLCALAPPIDIRGTHEGVEKKAEAQIASKQTWSSKVQGFLADIKVVFRHPVFVFTVAGATIYTGVIGSYAYWGPKAGRDVFRLPSQTADLTFGAITVVTGVLGTVTGGLLLDKIGSTIPNALLICGTGMAIGCVCIFLSFAVPKTLLGFIPLFAAGEFSLFSTQAPSSAVSLWSVPTGLRPFACSVMIVAVHALGDVPSPPLLGLMQGWVKNWRITMAVASVFLLLSSALYLMGMRAARRQPDYREQSHQALADAEAAEHDEDCSPLHSSLLLSNAEGLHHPSNGVAEDAGFS